MGNSIYAVCMLPQVFFCDPCLFLAIYTNLAIEVKLFLDQKKEAITVSDARQRLLRFYDTIPIHTDFAEVNKTQFKELNNRYRNKRKKKKERDDQVLQDYYVSIGAPPKAGVVTVRTDEAWGYII